MRQAFSIPIPQMGNTAMIAPLEPGPERAEANRRTGPQSTGPASPEGKARVRLDARKLGLRAEPVVFPGEDVETLIARIEAWKDHLQPRTDLEHYLAERVARVTWQIDRIDRAVAAWRKQRDRSRELDRDQAESDEVEDLARRLFWDPRGPIALYPHFRGCRSTPRRSVPDEVDDSLNPGRIVDRLEASYTGCRWLLERWADLRHLLEDGLHWQAPDRLRAIRLLGRQPMDAPADERVLSIYLACDAMDPCAPSSLADLRIEADDELAMFRDRVEGRGADRKRPRSMAAGKAALLALIEEVTTRLGDLLATHRERREFEKVMQADPMAFDDSPEGERLARYQRAKASELQRAIATYYKVRDQARRLRDDATPVGEPADAKTSVGRTRPRRRKPR
jgi:hypothetical protein